MRLGTGLVMVALLPGLAGCRPAVAGDGAVLFKPSAAEVYTRILNTAFTGGREPRGEYALCGVASHLFMALAHESEAKPSAETLLASAWIPFRPQARGGPWQVVPSREMSRPGVRAETFEGLLQGDVLAAWLTEPEEGATGIQGAIVCQGSADAPTLHRIMNADRRPSDNKLQRHLGVWTAAVVTWAYDATGHLPETAEGWSDVVLFAEPTPETAAWVREARATFDEALAYARFLE